MDIVQNSLAAGARTIEVIVDEQPATGRLTLAIIDDGRGMEPEQVARLADPFFTSRTTRRVGMGLPLLIQSVHQSDGDVKIDSTPGKGTAVTAWFDTSNIDMPPSGDIPGAILLTAAANPDVEFVLRYISGTGSYVFDTHEVREALDGLPISDPGVAKTLKEMINNNVRQLRL